MRIASGRAERESDGLRTGFPVPDASRRGAAAREVPRSPQVLDVVYVVAVLAVFGVVGLVAKAVDRL